MLEIYRCGGCGNFVVFLSEKTACTPKCCGEEMKALIPNTTDAAGEKHLPVISVEGNQVKVHVGSVEHPMAEEHYIEMILIETTEGFAKKDLKPGAAPEATFALAEGEKLVAAYAYCNLHGLWKTEA